MYDVTLYPLSSNPYVSYLYAGAYDLAADGHIRLRLGLVPRCDVRERHGPYNVPRNDHLFFMKVRDREAGLSKRVCIDLMDNKQISSLSGLRKSDVYYKRSYRREWYRDRHPEDEHKIRPFGLYFSVSTANEKQIMRRTLLVEAATGDLFRHPRAAIKNIRYEFKKRRQPATPARDDDWACNDRSEFEVPPRQPTLPRILFLTRVFDPSERPKPELAHALNEQRIRLIAAFREHFGNRFEGGLAGTAYARRVYPRYLATVSTARRDYLDLVRSCRVVISTEGLADSIPAKLAEYIAATRCILTDRLKYELPYEIADGKNVFYFDTAEQAIAGAETLLADNELAQQMRDNNYNLYREFVSPAAAMFRCMTDALQHQNARRPVEVERT